MMLDIATISVTSVISTTIGAIVSGVVVQIKHRYGGVYEMKNDIAEMKRISVQHNSLLLALAKALFASTKKEKDDAKVELLEVYSKLGGQ